MTHEDDRTAEQRTTHTWAVAGTDRFMSGWGGATGGTSVAAWACPYSELGAVLDHVTSRSEMKRVRVVKLDTWRPRAAHVHVYVWDGCRHMPPNPRGIPVVDAHDDLVGDTGTRPNP